MSIHNKSHEYQKMKQLIVGHWLKNEWLIWDIYWIWNVCFQDIDYIFHVWIGQIGHAKGIPGCFAYEFFQGEAYSYNSEDNKQVILLKGHAGNLAWFGMVRFGFEWFGIWVMYRCFACKISSS